MIGKQQQTSVHTHIIIIISSSNNNIKEPMQQPP
jgi:hypothetical protein